MPLPAVTKRRIARLLYGGANSFRDIARRCQVSDSTVRAMAARLGIVDPEPRPGKRKPTKRCKGCGGLIGKRQKSCPVCEHRFAQEIARRRRAFERRLKEDPRSITEW